MPKGGPLDRCHEKVKKSLIKNGVDKKEADKLAWGICKKRVGKKQSTVKVSKEDAECLSDFLKW